MRFYQYQVEELIDEAHPFLETDVDPKANWALNNLDLFPVEISTAPLEMLMRVPGIGPKGARDIVRARRTHALREHELRKLGIAFKRARYFITCNGQYAGSGIEFTREALHARLAAPINGGRHGRRADRVLPGQMSLFDQPFGPKLDGNQSSAPKLPEAAAATDPCVTLRSKRSLSAGDEVLAVWS